MKILIIADIHGHFDSVSDKLENINTSGFDLMLCPGDLTDMFNSPPGFSQMDVAEMLLQKLLAVKLPLYCVPGNNDPYETVDLFKEYGTNLHSTVRSLKGMKFMGFGGAETPFSSAFEPNEEEIAAGLERMGSDVKNNNFVLVVHNPPKGTKVDKTSDGKHVGSQAIREFIMKKQPLLAISAHIHESFAIDTIEKTTLFYPGPFYEGYYGVAEIKGEKVSCEIKRV
jgi:Icc-related predicted phosphoesterase